MAETIEKPAAINTKIAEYSVTTAALAELHQRFANVAFDVTTTKGDKEARAARLELVRLRTTLEAKRKELKAPALERSRLIDDEAKRITAAIVALEKPIDEQIVAAEQKREAERQAKIEAEQRRVAAIRARIDDIKSVAVRAFGKPAAEIEAKIKLLAGMTIGDSYQELKAEAEQAHAEALAAVRELHDVAVEKEALAARMAAERAELDRRKAEQEEAERVECERQATLQRAAAEQLAREREAFEAEKAAMRAAQERIDAQARAEREAADRQAAAERAEADRVARVARETEEQRLANERAALRLEQEERDRQVREETEARERQAREAREAEERAQREAAEAEERRQAEIRAEQRRLDEVAAIADKRVRDTAPMLLDALRALNGLVKGMSNDEHDRRPTDAELDAAIARADTVISVATGEPVNSLGSYYAADGTLMNADGTRSVFDDIDQ